MAIRFRCPRCNRVFSVQHDYAGMKAKCTCGCVLVVPALSEAGGPKALGDDSARLPHKPSQQPEVANSHASIGRTGHGQISAKTIAFNTFAFHPVKSISFPKVCVGCLSPKQNEKLKINVGRAMVSGKGSLLGGIIGGLTGAGVLGIAVGSALTTARVDGETSSYEITICGKCFSKLTKEEIKALRGHLLTPWSARNEFFYVEVDKGAVIFTFANSDYAKLFRKENIGKGQINSLELLVGPAKSLTKQLELLLEKLLPHAPKSKWYLRPNIPESKLNNAIMSYANDLDKGQILALLDSTIIGSAKHGLLITVDGIYYSGTPEVYEKSSGESVRWIEISKAFAVCTLPFPNVSRLKILLGCRDKREILCPTTTKEVCSNLQLLIDQVVLFLNS